MAYSWDFSFLWTYRWLLLGGLGTSVAFTIGTNILGLVVGIAAGLARASRHWPVRALTGAYIELFRCTPLLVQLVWVYYALPVLSGVQISAFAAASLTLTLYAGAFYAEIVRGGVASIDRGQWDGARALGLRRWPVLRLVILPQAGRRMIPPIINQTVLQLKNTSLISTLAVGDLLYTGSIITAATYRPLEVYTLIALLYFAVLFPTTLAASRAEQWLARRD